MTMSERRKQCIIWGTLGAIVAFGGYCSNKRESLRNMVEKEADVDKNGVTSLDEWESVYRAVGREPPLNLAMKMEKGFDRHTKVMQHPADGLSSKDMRRYLLEHDGRPWEKREWYTR